MNEEQASRRENEREANERFEKAIKEYLEALGYDDGMLMDWALITSQHHVHDDSSTGTSLSVRVGSEQPIYRTAGLLSYATEKTNRALFGN